MPFGTLFDPTPRALQNDDHHAAAIRLSNPQFRHQTEYAREPTVDRIYLTGSAAGVLDD